MENVDQALDIGSILRVLIKRRWVIIGVFIFIVVLRMISSYREKPAYQATATITIEKENANMLSLQALFSSDPYGFEYYQTQYKILESLTMARRVLEKLRAAKNDNFLQKHAAKNTGKRDVAEQAAVDDMLAANIKWGLKVMPEKNSRVVYIHYEAEDPVAAATLANTYVEAYIEYAYETKLEAVKNAVKWLNDNLETERKKVEEAELARLTYKQEYGIVADALTDPEPIAVPQLAELSAQVAAAEQARADAETRYKQAAAFADNPTMRAPVPEAFKKELFQNFRSMEEGLVQRREELSKKYDADHPKMLDIQGQLADLQAKKEQEIKRVVAALNDAYARALAKENSLNEELAAQKKKALEFNQKAVEYMGLRRDALSAQDMYSILLKKFKEISVAENVKMDNIRFIDKAEVPFIPIRPRRGRDIVLACMFGCLCAFSVAFFLEYLDQGIHLPEDIKNHLHIPSLGIIPLSGEPPADGAEHYLETINAPRSQSSESYRGIRTSILFSLADKEPQSILVTSAVAEEGKTTTAANLAIVMAQYGYKVVLIDSDFHRPRVRKLFSIPQEEGLSNLLVGNKEIKDALFETYVKNLYIIPSGPIPPNPSEILGSKRMQILVSQLKLRFNKIIIDSSPIVPLSDSLVMAKSVDGVVLVVKAGKTPRKVVRAAVEKFEGINAPILGAVLNSVDIKNAGYYYSRQYYGYSYGMDGQHRKKKKSTIEKIKRNIPFFGRRA
ncbi:MAG: polysaccharide biosynthesis tyrosine autokinase [Deltaproteobacteria bacterium]|nr:polysaccharide biosynthesis tyrosine autokinase [Deltaproteobacteria bacterium]